MSVSKSSLRRLEKRFAPKLSYEAYMDAVHRHHDRRVRMLSRPYERIQAILDGRELPPEMLGPFTISPDEEREWVRDHNLITAYHQQHFGVSDGMNLLAWGRTPEEMLQHMRQVMSRPGNMLSEMIRRDLEEAGLTEIDPA